MVYKIVNFYYNILLFPILKHLGYWLKNGQNIIIWLLLKNLVVMGLYWWFCFIW